MTLDLTHNHNIWTVKFDNELEMVWVMLNGKDVSKRIFKSSCFEDVLYKYFDERYNLDHARFCYDNNAD